ILYAQAGGAGSAQAAGSIARRLNAAGIAQRTVRRDYRGLEVLDGTAGPAVLIETGFLSNPRDAARLADSRYQRKLADAAAKGIADYLARR
ncbi:MAG: N-acetylmuramoyl-L-alanine amidase, partial [Phycisphaerae bacterium]